MYMCQLQCTWYKIVSSIKSNRVLSKDCLILIVMVVSMVYILSHLQVMRSLLVTVVLRLSIPLSPVAPTLLPAPIPAHIPSTGVPKVYLPHARRRCVWKDMRYIFSYSIHMMWLSPFSTLSLSFHLSLLPSSFLNSKITTHKNL